MQQLLKEKLNKLLIQKSKEKPIKNLEVIKIPISFLFKVNLENFYYFTIYKDFNVLFLCCVK